MVGGPGLVVTDVVVGAVTVVVPVVSVMVGGGATVVVGLMITVVSVSVAAVVVVVVVVDDVVVEEADPITPQATRLAVCCDAATVGHCPDTVEAEHRHHPPALARLAIAYQGPAIGEGRSSNQRISIIIYIELIV